MLVSYASDLFQVRTLLIWIATNARGEREDFWGFDHIGQVIDHLGLERQLGTRNEGGWKAML